jgi:YgiT-type zinc finger domain-containing protein
MMKDVLHSACSECGGSVRSRTITQEFEREGMRVSVAGIRTLVCTKCNAVYFEPGGAQALVEAVNSLFAFAKQNQQHKGKLVSAIQPA